MDTAQFIGELTVLLLAIFLGFEVISKVPTLLHTPLMSGTNAIHGIVVVGAILVAGAADPDPEVVLEPVLREGDDDREQHPGGADEVPEACVAGRREEAQRQDEADDRDEIGETNRVGAAHRASS